MTITSSHTFISLACVYTYSKIWWSILIIMLLKKKEKKIAKNQAQLKMLYSFLSGNLQTIHLFCFFLSFYLIVPLSVLNPYDEYGAGEWSFRILKIKIHFFINSSIACWVRESESANGWNHHNSRCIYLFIRNPSSQTTAATFSKPNAFAFFHSQ